VITFTLIIKSLLTPMTQKSGRLLILLVITILSACTSGKKLYERGAYYEAVMASVQKLRQNPDHKKSAEALKNSYPMALEFLETDAKNQIASNSPNKWRNAIATYDKINQMYESIRQSPKALKIIKDPKNFYNEIGPLKEKAAEESYNAGIDALMKGNREEAKKAYYNFADAQAFSPGYKDVVEYLDKSKDEATLKVIVEQVAGSRLY
jgi:tetratricopeptide (TPR) repeat protein